MLSETTMARLALIRYWYSFGIEQSRQPEPLGVMSLLTFHDSVELFLHLASEHLNISGDTSKLNFMDYWPKINANLTSGQLSQHVSMSKLNRARVNLKHAGVLPSKMDIESFRVNVTDFFEDNVPIVFGIPFAEISLLCLVQYPTARKQLEEAELLMKEGDIGNALEHIALAYAWVISDFENRKRMYSDSPFYFGKDMTFQNGFFLGLHEGELRKIGDFVDNVKDSIESLRSAVKVLALGIDYRHYAKFMLLTPPVHDVTTNPNNREFLVTPIAQWREQPPSIEECHYCFDFVIETAIRLQQFDFTVDDYQPPTMGSPGRMTIKSTTNSEK